MGVGALNWASRIGAGPDASAAFCDERPSRRLDQPLGNAVEYRARFADAYAEAIKTDRPSLRIIDEGLGSRGGKVVDTSDCLITDVRCLDCGLRCLRVLQAAGESVENRDPAMRFLEGAQAYSRR